MTDIEHASDSADQCTKDETDKGSGASANAGSRPDMVLITTTPLSELVWSQHEGLSLQYVASSIAEKKASLLWNTESFDILISSPQCANGGESRNSRDFAEGDLLQLKPNAEEKNSGNVTLPGSPVNSIGRKPVTLMRIHEQDSRSFGDTELPKRTEEVDLDKKDVEDNQSDEKEVENNTSSFDILRSETNAVDIIHDQALVPGPDNYVPSAESLSCNLKELRPDLVRVEFECVSNVQTSPDNAKVSKQMENYKTSSLVIVPDDQHSLLAKCGSPLKSSSSARSAECRDADLSLGTAEECTNSGMAQHLTSLNPLERQCSGEVQSFHVGFSMPVIPQPADECKDGTFQASHKDKSLSLGTAEECTNSQMAQHLTSLNPLERQCSGEVQSFHVGFSMPVIPQPADECKDGTFQASHKDKSVPIGSLSDGNVNDINMGKGKERVISDAEDSESISQESKDSHESVESSNSKRLTSTGKRARSHDSKMFVESTRLKKQICGSSHSGSFLRQGSSFMNWISTITNGFSRLSEPTPLASVPQPSHHREGSLNCIRLSHMDSKGVGIACRNMGFESIFESLYYPGFSVKNSTNGYLDHQREADASEELKFEGEQLGHSTCQILCESVEFNLRSIVPTKGERANSGSKDHVSSEQIKIGSLHIACDGDGDKLRNEVSMSSQRLNQYTCQFEELPSTRINMSSTDSRFHEKTKSDFGQTCNNVSNIESKSSSAKNASQSSSDGKGAGIFVPVSNSSSNLLTNNRNGFLQNLWITRFSPKVSSTIPNSVQCNRGIDLATENLTNNCNILESLFQNDAAYNKGQNSSENCRLLSLEGQRDVMNGEKWKNSTCPADKCGLKEMGDQKLKSKLNPILPAQKFRKTEPMASTFAKRLDAFKFKHIGPSKVPNDVTMATTTCFFCGRSGHSIRECSELPETELEDLLQNMNSYDGIDKSSCLCIRCFQLDHWAIACTYASSKRKHVTRNAFSVCYEDCDRTKNEPINHSFANHDGGITLWSGRKQEHQLVTGHKLPRRGNVRVDTDVVVHSNESSSTGKVVALNEENLHSNLVKENIGESTVKVKPTSSRSGENESKGKQIIPLCNYVSTEVINESIGIFETIKRLRLSRTDIIRWMKSPNSHFNLKGFFLRLRIGKLEEGLGGTGYHVASIHGARCENCISVCIAGLTYLVDCRFVSNHDFVEDELKAWWSATLKDGGKPPSMEELNKKLQERTKLGF